MKQLLSVFIICIVFTGTSKAQYFEIGGFTGISNYFGDLQPVHLVPEEYNLACGLFVRMNLNRHFSGRLAISHGQISGNDLNSDSPSELRKRNLNFRSKIYELAAIGEFNFIPYDLRNNKVAAVYIFGGLSVFHFNPTTEFEGNKYNLQKIGTEGQHLEGSSVKPYSLVQLAIPMGIGTKFNINNRSNIGFEVGFRKTFTDYLDDVSGHYPDLDALAASNPVAAALSYREAEYHGVTPKALGNPVERVRGNPKKKDWFFFMGVTLSVNLGDYSTMAHTNRYKYFMMSF